MSDRAGNEFIPVNCGAIAEPLFEREMFGHRKGSFTGAHADIPGVFAMAHQGTIFLDEVGDLPFAMQVKLLRVLTDGEHKPVGSPNHHYTDVRVIAATNRKLENLVEQGHFRKDLFYRLHVIPITVPPLRERREDIPLLIEHFLELCDQDEIQRTLPKDILRQLITYDWPGNVRELQNVLRQYMVTQNMSFAGKRAAQPVEAGIESLQEPRPLHEAIKEFEKHVITQVLVSHQWNREEAAATLGISARTLRRKIQEYQIIKPYKRFPTDS